MREVEGLTNQYIETLGKRILGSNFLGCFASDVPPKTNKKNFSVIFNLSEVNSKSKDDSNEHFIAIVFNNEKIMYFDSFGRKCSNKNILKFIKIRKGNRTLFENTEQVQSCSSYFCGYYCISFLIACKLKIKLNTFLEMFDKNNLIKNDKIVVNYIQNFIKLKHIDQ